MNDNLYVEKFNNILYKSVLELERNVVCKENEKIIHIDLTLGEFLELQALINLNSSNNNSSKVKELFDIKEKMFINSIIQKIK